MRARPYRTAALVLCLTGCSGSVDPTYKDPAACVAAYGYLFLVAEGTPLENDPQHAELKTRILFQLEKLQKKEILETGQARASKIEKQLKKKTDLAYSLATHCMAEEGATGDYDRERPRLKAIAERQR